MQRYLFLPQFPKNSLVLSPLQPKMTILRSLLDLYTWRNNLGEKTLGFVPTMGALHQGHLSLVEQSLSQCETTLVSIYVNPTQFNNPDDLAKYPSTLDQDLALLKEAGDVVVYLPKQEDLYPNGLALEALILVLWANSWKAPVVQDILKEWQQWSPILRDHQTAQSLFWGEGLPAAGYN